MVCLRFVPLVVSLVLLFGARPAPGEEADKARDEAAKAFESLYGADVKRVRATRERADDIAMARRLLVVAKAAAAQPEFMAILCEKADELASVSLDGYGTVVEAMELLARKSPERAVACSERIVEIRQKHFAAAKGADRLQAGEALLDALLSLMDANMTAGETDEAMTVGRRAAAVARAANSPRKEEVAARQKNLVQRAREASEIEALKKQLAAEPQNHAVRERLVRRLLIDRDNPAAAARYVQGLKDTSLLKHVPAAAKPLEVAPELACLELGDWYRGLGETASPGAKAAMLARARAYYKRFLELHLYQDLDRTRASIAMKKIEQQLAATQSAPHATPRTHLEGPKLCKALAAGLQRELASSRKGKAPRPIRHTEPIVGTVEWPGDKGYLGRPQGEITIGHGYDEQLKKYGPDGTVAATPGFVLEGGAVYVEHGVLRLEGSPAQPVMLMNVDLSASNRGQVEARYTIFANCKFKKGGGKMWSRYSSKWEFDNCVLAQSNFDSLEQVNYGIKANNCLFFRCTLPERILTRATWADPHPKETGIAELYQDEWNEVSKCHFVECGIAPSFVWATDKCDFNVCRVEGTGSFASTDSLRVILHVAAKEEAFVRELVKRTIHRGTGKVAFENSPAPFAAGLPWTAKLVGGGK